MNRNIYYQTTIPILLFLLCLNICFAQVSDKPTFCWKVLSKKSKTPSYIFGTIHHLGYKPILWNKVLLARILKSKFIVLEIDTIEVKKNYLSFNGNASTSLDKLISAADYQIVKDAYLKYTGRDIERNKYKMPLTISSDIRNGKESNEPHVTQMEAAFYTISKDSNIVIKGLETRAYRDSMFSSFTLDEQVKMMMHEIKQVLLDKIKGEYQACFEKNDLDCACNINDMNHYSQTGDSTIVVKRNLYWIKKIEKYIEEGNAFIAIGAAHLCGDYGIISLLKKDGYTIVPVLSN